MVKTKKQIRTADMTMVSRTLLRVINRQEGIDCHVFIYGKESEERAAALLSEFNSLSLKFGIPNNVNWLESAEDKSKDFGDKRFASFFREGWLIMLRDDQIESRNGKAAINDNEISFESEITRIEK